MPSRLGARLGYRLAQAGAVFHVIGGSVDLFTRKLQPFHEAYLGVAPGAASRPTQNLILALLHAIGVGLIASGIGQLVLLGHMRRGGIPWLGGIVALLALGAEGSVGIRMLQLGFGFGWIPIGIAALVWIGILLIVIPRFGLTSDN